MGAKDKARAMWAAASKKLHSKVDAQSGADNVMEEDDRRGHEHDKGRVSKRKRLADEGDNGHLRGSAAGEPTDERRRAVGAWAGRGGGERGKDRRKGEGHRGNDLRVGTGLGSADGGREAGGSGEGSREEQRAARKAEKKARR